jgi:hypothetical protein
MRLKYPNYLCFSVPNEAAYRNKQYFSNLGMMPGVSDLIIVLPSKILFVELKSKVGRQSVEQKGFMEKVEALGFDYHLIRNLDDFIEIIENELN